jgi:hypothetical protein
MAPMSTTAPTAPPTIGPILTEDFARGVLDGEVVRDDAAEDVRVKLSEPGGEPAATSGRPGDNGRWIDERLFITQPYRRLPRQRD